MKVLQINAVYGNGSTGRIIRDLQDYCEINGIECYVAYAHADSRVKKGYKIATHVEVFLHALLCRISGRQAYFSRFATFRLIRYIHKLSPEIIHLHNLHSNFIHLNLLLRFLARNDIHTIITLHDCWWYTGGCFHYSAANCDKWISGCGHCPKRFTDTPAYLYDASKAILHDRKEYLLAIPHLTIVGVSNWITEESRKSFLCTKPIITIHNGIDLSVFKPTISDLRERLGLIGKYVILGPASKWLDPINRDVLLYFSEHLRGNDVLLLFGYTGRGSSLFPKGIRTYGYTHDAKELAALYTMADVFVNPSREESFGLINIEAQACGTPVVAFCGTGVSETVGRENLVEMGDYEALYLKSFAVEKGQSPVLYSHVDQCYAYVSLYKDEYHQID